MHVSFLTQANYGSGDKGAEVTVANGEESPTELTVPAALDGMDAFRLVIALDENAVETVYVLPATGDNRTSALQIKPGQVFETHTFRRSRVPRLFATGPCDVYISFLGVGNEV
jgi:hypothetical protein